jgi:heptosyltransferase-1
MGDVIHTLPAAATLRRAFPDAQIGWVVEERWAELLCAKGTARSGPRSPSRPFVDFVHVVNTKSWRKAPLSTETRRQLSAALSEVRERKYEVAIDFQGAIKSALLARLSDAGTVFGAQQPRESPAKIFYARRIETAGTHVVEQYESLAQAVMREFAPAASRSNPSLGAGVQAREGSKNRVGTGAHARPVEQSSTFALPHDPAAETALSDKLQNIGERFVILNPGAGWGAKQWPAERYGEVARALAQHGFATIVNFGPGEEELADAAARASGGVARPLRCSLAELVALTRRASLFIGGDTGPLHLATALGIPVVAIFGPTDPSRNGPYGGKSIVLRNPASQTSLSHTSAPDPGLMQIRAEDVLSAARRLLEHPDA